MNWTVASENLRFDRQNRSTIRRLIPIGIALALFTILWRLVPHNTLYWLMLPLIAILVWITSYGWRQALAALIAMLLRLEQV